MMGERRKLLIALIGALAFTASVRAEMTPVCKLDAERWQAPCVCDRTDPAHTNLSPPVSCSSMAYLKLWSIQLLPGPNANITQTSEIQHPQITADSTGSYSLCLYALIGLGVCKSAPLVKKLSFGFIPQWFHDGGPFQIGHSFAASPESLCCPAPACCFIQPVCTVQPLISRYRLRTIVSLWRESQFTPVALAPRAPPLSC